MDKFMYVVTVKIPSNLLGYVPCKYAFHAEQEANAFVLDYAPYAEVVRSEGHYIDTYLPIAGHKVIEYGKDSDCDGMYVPWQTGYWAYRTEQEAYKDACSWAAAEELPVLYNAKYYKRVPLGIVS
jgi:hypothetical protein